MEEDDLNDIVLRLYGRAKFCHDTGEIKSHDLFKEAAREIEFLKEELENQEDLNDMYRDENEQMRGALLRISWSNNLPFIWEVSKSALKNKAD